MTEQYIGIPFVDRGRTIKGFDCWGLVMFIYSDMLNIQLPDFPISASDTDGVTNAMGESVSKGEWVRVEDPVFGDIVAMALDKRMLRAINHVGICTGDGRFIHSIMGQSSASCRLDDMYWSNRIRGYYRWQG